MNSSKVSELYNSLSTIEKNRFRRYVQNPTINSNPNLVKLSGLVGETTLTKKELYKSLFGNESYSDKKLRYLLSNLMHHLETFISDSKISENKLLLNEYLISEFKERNLEKHFVGKSRLYSKELESQDVHDAIHYFRKYTHEKELDDYFMKKEIRQENTSLQNKSDNLEIFYLSEKLHVLCEMVNRKNIIGTNYQLNLMEDLIGYVRKNISKFQQIPAVHIYYRILMTLLEENITEHFTELKKSLENGYREFSKEEARQMFDYAQNYCIKKLNSGRQEYVAELFSIYESLLEAGLIFENDYLSQWDYKNIVSTSLKLGKFEWTKHFIEDYKKKILPEFRENAYEYNLALYYFTNKEYRNALKLLQGIEFTDVFYHLGAKAMMLKIYFELDEVEPFYSLTDAYKVYLARTRKISNYQRQMHQALVRHTKQAFNLKIRASSSSKFTVDKAIDKLKAKIEINKNKTDFSWLLERINEMQGNQKST